MRENGGDGCLSWIVSFLVSLITAVLVNLWLSGKL